MVKRCFVACLLWLSYVAVVCAQSPLQREIAITIDDLPAASPWMGGAEMVEMTTKLLGTLRDQKVPAVGFVNEQKLYKQFGEVDQRIKVLGMWTEYGFELGNHTFSHFR
jgi:peptidoglycan/xylan/chitin deacetylase (PgdA/CDA1 family)